MAPSPRVWQTEAPSDHPLPFPTPAPSPVGAPRWARPPFSRAVMVWTRNPWATWPRANGPPAEPRGPPWRCAHEGLLLGPQRAGSGAQPHSSRPGCRRPLRPSSPTNPGASSSRNRTAYASRGPTPCRTRCTLNGHREPPDVPRVLQSSPSTSGCVGSASRGP